MSVVVSLLPSDCRNSSSEVAALCPLVQGFQLLEARPPLFQTLVTRCSLFQPSGAKGTQRPGQRASPLGGEDLQGVKGRRLRVLVGITDNFTQVAGQVLAGERQALAGQLSRSAGICRLALSRRPGWGHVPADGGGAGGDGGGGGGARARSGGGVRLAEVLLLRLLLLGRWVVVDGSGSAVLHRLGRTGLERLLEFCHVVCILKERKAENETRAAVTNNKIICIALDGITSGDRNAGGVIAAASVTKKQTDPRT